MCAAQRGLANTDALCGAPCLCIACAISFFVCFFCWWNTVALCVCGGFRWRCVCARVRGSLGWLRRTWRADASERAGDVCSRQPLAFDEGRRGRGWRVRATVASPRRITAALSSPRHSVPPRFSVLSLFLYFLFFSSSSPTGFEGLGLFG